jgi:aconitate hydratase
MVKGRKVHTELSYDINPTSRQIIEYMVQNGVMLNLVQSGARIHQAGCNGCIGMGQAPATGRNSLRTVPRNFPDRSGTPEDSVFLVSPETATASALTGKITDPRDMEDIYGMSYPKFQNPKGDVLGDDLLLAPPENGEDIKLEKGPNISTMPDFDELSDFKVPVLLKMGDNISTDEILRAGAEVLPFRSNIPEISKFTLDVVDKNFHDRAMEAKDEYGGHIVVAGENYAQGSSREHAAIAPRYLGMKAVAAKSYARIGWQNLANFGIIPLEFKNEDDYEQIEQGDIISVNDIREAIKNGEDVVLTNETKDEEYELAHTLSDRQRDAVLEGSVINWFKNNRNN